VTARSSRRGSGGQHGVTGPRAVRPRARRDRFQWQRRMDGGRRTPGRYSASRGMRANEGVSTATNRVIAAPSPASAPFGGKRVGCRPAAGSPEPPRRDACASPHRPDTLRVHGTRPPMYNNEESTNTNKQTNKTTIFWSLFLFFFFHFFFFFFIYVVFVFFKQQKLRPHVTIAPLCYAGMIYLFQDTLYGWFFFLLCIKCFTTYIRTGQLRNISGYTPFLFYVWVAIAIASQ